MIVIFFKNDIQSVRRMIGLIPNSTAFWYSPGLQSYEYLKEVITISKIHIERSIFQSFFESYSDLLRSTPYEIFDEYRELGPASEVKPYLFLASSDTITRSYKPVIDNLRDIGFKMVCKPKENAKKAADSLNITASNIGLKVDDVDNYSLLILGNDWGPTERKINEDFLRFGKNSVCIQESSIDFNPKDKRMRSCSFPVFQGVATLQNLPLDGLICGVVGNPRFEELKASPMPSEFKALINVNFTYGVFEDVRDGWVSDIVSTCGDLRLDYVISQHPRDRGDFSKYNVLHSNAMLVHETIKESSVVISRFSALLTESICLGRPCIYYNPHGENLYYKFEPDNKMFYVAKDKLELKRALTSILKMQIEGANHDLEFLSKHLGVTHKGEASKYIVRLLDDVAKYPPLKRSNLLNRIFIYLLILKRMLRMQRY